MPSAVVDPEANDGATALMTYGCRWLHFKTGSMPGSLPVQKRMPMVSDGPGQPLLVPAFGGHTDTGQALLVAGAVVDAPIACTAPDFLDRVNPP